ncbi:mucin-2-like, partial [Topomyia yanbarensis]|uniref:mucin-2-like n=1 Tax=Topomyia yanbarensis TaxID=2498891 RepID=UPI00273AF51D
MWSSIRRPGQFPKKGNNVAPQTSATSIAATAAMHAVLSGPDGCKSPYGLINNGFNRITKKMENDSKNTTRENIPLHPLLLDGSSGDQTGRLHLKCANLNSSLVKSIRDAPGVCWLCPQCRVQSNRNNSSNDTMNLILQRTNTALKLIGGLSDTMQIICRMYSQQCTKPSCHSGLRNNADKISNDGAPFLEFLDDLQFNISNLYESLIDDNNKRPRTSSTSRPSLSQPDKIPRVDVPISSPSATNIIASSVSDSNSHTNLLPGSSNSDGIITNDQLNNSTTCGLPYASASSVHSRMDFFDSTAAAPTAAASSHFNPAPTNTITTDFEPTETETTTTVVDPIATNAQHATPSALNTITTNITFAPLPPRTASARPPAPTATACLSVLPPPLLTATTTSSANANAFCNALQNHSSSGIASSSTSTAQPTTLTHAASRYIHSTLVDTNTLRNPPLINQNNSARQVNVISNIPYVGPNQFRVPRPAGSHGYSNDSQDNQANQITPLLVAPTTQHVPVASYE